MKQVLTQSVGIDDSVDRLLWIAVGEGVADMARRRVTKALQNMGRRYGYTIREDSIVFLPELEQGDGVLVRGRWCPDPVRGCELLGGPHDGAVLPVDRTADGWPVDRTSADGAAWYRRVGIDPVRDRWVFEFEGEK